MSAKSKLAGGIFKPPFTVQGTKAGDVASLTNLRSVAAHVSEARRKTEVAFTRYERDCLDAKAKLDIGDLGKPGYERATHNAREKALIDTGQNENRFQPLVGVEHEESELFSRDRFWVRFVRVEHPELGRHRCLFVLVCVPPRRAEDGQVSIDRVAGERLAVLAVPPPTHEGQQRIGIHLNQWLLRAEVALETKATVSSGADRAGFPAEGLLEEKPAIEDGANGPFAAWLGAHLGQVKCPRGLGLLLGPPTFGLRTRPLSNRRSKYQVSRFW